MVFLLSQKSYVSAFSTQDLPRRTHKEYTSGNKIKIQIYSLEGGMWKEQGWEEIVTSPIKFSMFEIY